MTSLSRFLSVLPVTLENKSRVVLGITGVVEVFLFPLLAKHSLIFSGKKRTRGGEGVPERSKRPPPRALRSEFLTSIQSRIKNLFEILKI